jgi:hypothetical protein
MKLWILKPIRLPGADPWEPWYDKCFGFIVSAETSEKARKLAAVDGGDECHKFRNGAIDINPWLEPKYSTCKELKPGKRSGIIMRDFAAA